MATPSSKLPNLLTTIARADCVEIDDEHFVRYFTYDEGAGLHIDASESGGPDLRISPESIAAAIQLPADDAWLVEAECDGDTDHYRLSFFSLVKA